MENFIQHKIIEIQTLSDYLIKLIFDDNSDYIFDLKEYFTVDSVFNSLKDINKFNNVRITDNGRALEFPDELDFCSDSLWMKANKIFYY